jgi:phage N-6-adenine-methyltransferase
MNRPDDHRTPDDIFQALSERYGPFDLDVAASDENHRCPLYFTKKNNALFQNWTEDHIWMNPPYYAIDEWVDWAIIQLSHKSCKTITMLLPSRTDRPWFRKLFKIAKHIHFIEGRLDFSGPHQINNSCSPQGTIVFYLTQDLTYDGYVSFMKKNGDLI